jgi:elongation factor 1-gamma
MTPPQYTLHAPPGSFRAFPALIVAEYNGVAVDVADPFDATKVATLSPTGKAPILQLPSGPPLFSSHAIARFLAGIRRDTGLTGSSLQEAASIDAWMDFSAQELELPACVWFYPVGLDACIAEILAFLSLLLLTVHSSCALGCWLHAFSQGSVSLAGAV